MLARDDDGRFAPELNDLGDGGSVPLLQFSHYRICAVFLRFHYELIPGRSDLLIPVERALLPEEYISSEQNHNIEHHLHKTKQAQIAIDESPGIQKNCF